MMDRLNELIKSINSESLPPVDQWNPDFCGDMDMVIRRNGDWVHEGQLIQRKKLVNLFASILKREGDDYFLVTPVEKVGIKVESTPFVVTQSELIGDTWFITNNLNQVAELNKDSQLNVEDDQNPFLIWRSNLPARVSQSVMYQWQMFALEIGEVHDNRLWLLSDGSQISLGKTEE
jgi:hypothetical protein